MTAPDASGFGAVVATFVGPAAAVVFCGVDEETATVAFGVAPAGAAWIGRAPRLATVTGFVLIIAAAVGADCISAAGFGGTPALGMETSSSEVSLSRLSATL